MIWLNFFGYYIFTLEKYYCFILSWTYFTTENTEKIKETNIIELVSTRPATDNIPKEL